ncbi:MAG: UDP-diphospho-muramoylpentapeptide beta-N-acetylglucosaminyltransferase [Gammaproteobacteria bacterium SG8_15]|nr:MAG: UDP-diphospho-muramoylpentapeptide beta-N-acetylglucosaminyltransferase [Gammaproteobacteria bacterium SG8_15]
MTSTRILIMAGGTGGHVFPALAVADDLRARGVEVFWLGTRRGLEADVIPKANIPISYINVAGLRGKGLLGWVLAPLKLMYALWQGLNVMRQLKPQAVLGMGGFVTGPGGVAAWLTRKPLLVHEQNAISGMTNRMLVPFARVVMEAFPNSIAPGKAIHTGNPVRENITRLYQTGESQRKIHEPLHILVVGGSLGAKALNDVVPAALSKIPVASRPVVWHQTGKKNIAEAQASYQQSGVDAKVVPFIDDMAEAYRWADLVICRAGAMTIAELAIAGVASILVPYPYAVDDHQTSNAKYLVNKDAAVLVQQKDLSVDVLHKLLAELTKSRLQQMAKSARSLALPDATRRVADHCLGAAHA